ncbi:Sugar phosphate isomerase/epimerase [Singulisphaera sp. GP187]|uniref:sugar phosphate isomerase/epimerase family protein n=1 Tax=Singulisphaera sp. GP187 TaxID=1882752 RepID=UPI00092CAC2C|nr:sugar phosphate isomerase/epimerase [Singulisphaera sp. GP187]SIO08410.1 Sugar phosphate isomerase/epimerase [Singulisphaera sp. GP187]
MRSDISRELTRRELLTAGLAAAGALALHTQVKAAPSAAEGPYGPFKMGLQSYSLRGYMANGKPDVEKALAITKDLGLHHWEAYPAHFPIVASADEIAGYKKKSAAHGVSVIGYGVIPFTKDHEANRKFFEYAKAMDFGYLSADPALDSFDSLDKLVEEYGVGVGIHNHGPGHHYALIDTIAATIKNHHPKIGCCIDTGHFLRSNEDPVRAAEVFGKRIYGVHLKDVKENKAAKDVTERMKFTVLGHGDLRTAELLKVLAGLDYQYCLALEYEENVLNPVADLRACLAAVREAVSTLKKS